MAGPHASNGAAVVATDARSDTRTLAFLDLDASVHVGGLSPDLLAELPGLYGSLFSTEAWFRIWDRRSPEGACVLEDPHHVLLYYVQDRTIEVLNKAFRISPRDVRRACAALFRTVPDAERIHVEVMFPPSELKVPMRVLSAADDMVIPLPATTAEYTASLGKKTRKNLRNFGNRLEREHPGFTVAHFAPGHESGRIVEQFLAWHLDRSRDRGVVSIYQRHPEQAAQLAALLEECGEAQVTTVAGEMAAIEIIFYVNEDAVIYAGSFDEQHAELHLGLLSTYWAICQALERGARRCHLLWAWGYYKTLLGGTPERATRLSVFRSPQAKLLFPAEWVKVEIDRLRGLDTYYWKTRHLVRRAIEPAARLLHIPLPHGRR